MPKGRKIVKTNTTVKKLNNKRSQLIGTRKSGVSAHSMTTQALQDVLTDTSKTKWRNTAANVLRTRVRAHARARAPGGTL